MIHLKLSTNLFHEDFFDFFCKKYISLKTITLFMNSQSWLYLYHTTAIGQPVYANTYLSP